MKRSMRDLPVGGPPAPIIIKASSLARRGKAGRPMSRCTPEVDCDHMREWLAVVDDNDRRLNYLIDLVHKLRKTLPCLAYFNLVIKDDGIILGVDYFGPPRLQIGFESIHIINDIFA